MITIRKLKNTDLDAVLKLKVADGQVPFVGIISELIAEIPNGIDSHVILAGEQIVGFFKIDTTYADNYDFTLENEIGLRAFFIDENHQGRGYGKSASQALKTYLATHYQGYGSIALTVNCKNPNAFNAYIRGGFIDSGELYLGGRAGPQYIMRMVIEP